MSCLINVVVMFSCRKNKEGRWVEVRDTYQESIARERWQICWYPFNVFAISDDNLSFFGFKIEFWFFLCLFTTKSFTALCTSSKIDAQIEITLRFPLFSIFFFDRLSSIIYVDSYMFFLLRICRSIISQGQKNSSQNP